MMLFHVMLFKKKNYIPTFPIVLQQLTGRIQSREKDAVPCLLAAPFNNLRAT